MFEYDEKKNLIVDELFYDPHLSNSMVARIEEEYFIVITNSERPIHEKYIKKYKKTPQKEWSVANYEYIIHGMTKRSGFDVKLGRAINAEEFKEIEERYNLTEDDVSEEFTNEKGSIYGESNMKSFNATQIKIDNDKALQLERELTEKGIEASNGAHGRVNIRTEWGGARKGAGRPSTGRSKKNYYVSDEEDKAIKKLIADMRKN